MPASIVVLLVALPLCAGMRWGPVPPYFQSIIAGIVGEYCNRFFNWFTPECERTPLPDSTVIVATAILKLQVYEAFLLAIVIAGFIQLALGFLKAGVMATSCS